MRARRAEDVSNETVSEHEIEHVSDIEHANELRHRWQGTAQESDARCLATSMAKLK